MHANPPKYEIMRIVSVSLSRSSAKAQLSFSECQTKNSPLTLSKITCAGSETEATPEAEARMWATVTDKLLRSMATENEWRFPSRHLLQEDVTGTG